MLKSSHWNGLLIWEGQLLKSGEKSYLECYWISNHGISSEYSQGNLVIKSILFKDNKVMDTIELECEKDNANNLLSSKLLRLNIF